MNSKLLISCNDKQTIRKKLNVIQDVIDHFMIDIYIRNDFNINNLSKYIILSFTFR